MKLKKIITQNKGFSITTTKAYYINAKYKGAYKIINIVKTIIKEISKGFIGLALGSIAYFSFYHFNNIFVQSVCLIGLYFIVKSWRAFSK